MDKTLESTLKAGMNTKIGDLSWRRSLHRWWRHIQVVYGG
jgi:hypothetical protein